jgi:putative inorganic carbon (HCO3(-)) transporter
LLFLTGQRKVVAACILIPAVLLAPLVLPDKVFQRADQIEGYEEDVSANQRLQSWTVAFNLAKDYPLTGGGFELEYAPDDSRWLSYTSDKYRWALDQRTSAAHSIYFQMLGQHGFVALFLFLTLCFGALMNLRRIKKKALANKDTAWVADYATGIQAGLVGYMVSGAFLNSAYFDLAWLYFAMTAILQREVILVSNPRSLQPSLGTARGKPVAASRRGAPSASGQTGVRRNALAPSGRAPLKSEFAPR